MRSAGRRMVPTLLLLGTLALPGCDDADVAERPTAETAAIESDPHGADAGGVVVRPIQEAEPPRTLLLDEAFDLSGDGAPERILLYVDAERDGAGRLQWDDGQRWALHVLAGGAVYPLFDGYVQIGRLRFWIIEPGGTVGAARIVLLKETGAGVELRSYRFEPDRGFIGAVEYTTSGNVVFTSPEIR
jgi:hypothetical protein